jgi:hypothetical protein
LLGSVLVYTCCLNIVVNSITFYSQMCPSL